MVKCADVEMGWISIAHFHLAHFYISTFSHFLNGVSFQTD